MPVKAFIDLDVTAQINDLRAYLTTTGIEVSKTEVTVDNIATQLKEIVPLTSKCWASFNNESEAEGVFNYIISILDEGVTDPKDISAIVSLLCQHAGSLEKTDHTASCRLRIMCNLFGALQEDSPCRYDILCTILRLCSQADLVHHLPTEINTFKRWFSQWDATPNQQQEVWRLLLHAMQESKNSSYTEASMRVMIELLGTYSMQDAALAGQEAQKCIVDSLKDPKTFLFDHLLNLKPILYLEGSRIHDLLTIFVSKRLEDYLAFYAEKKDFVDKLDVSHEALVEKMRVLTFFSMAERRSEVSFSSIQEELQISEEEVETVLIELVRTSSVRVRMDQANSLVRITSCPLRIFGKQHWQTLYKILQGWQTQLTSVRDQLGAVISRAEATA